MKRSRLVLVSALVVVAGRPLYGLTSLLEPLREAMPDGGATLARLSVEGQPRAIELELGRRLHALQKRHPALDRVPWLASVRAGIDEAPVGRSRS